MLEEGLDRQVIKKLGLQAKETPELSDWMAFLDAIHNPEKTIRIALIGKYVQYHDAYKSIAEAVAHAAAANRVKVEIDWVQSDDLTEENIEEKLAGISGMIVAPGFGGRGIAGKLSAVKYARTRGIPFFGICLGMQCAVIEFARNVCGWKDANSTEFDPNTPFPIIDMMADQREISQKGGTMRLGLYRCSVKEGSKAHAAYKCTEVYERHRHRFEVNNSLRYRLAEEGMRFSGMNPERDLVEIVELDNHPWFVGVQFHPEFTSRVTRPQPLFVDFVRASSKHADENGLVLEPEMTAAHEQ
jgi:CTP synthase